MTKPQVKTMKPCAGCKYDSKVIACTHPRALFESFWENLMVDDSGYPMCYEKQKAPGAS